MHSILSLTLYLSPEELGMVNIPPSWDIQKEYKDVGTIGFWEEIVHAAETDPSMIEKGLEGTHKIARDHARTPMQWTADAPHGGFSSTTGETWMRANDSFTTINVAQQEKDAESPLTFYRSLLKLRKAEPALVIRGLFELVDRDHEATFLYVKRAGTKAMLVALNFTAATQAFVVPKALVGKVELGISSLGMPGVVAGELRAFEAQIFLPL